MNLGVAGPENAAASVAAESSSAARSIAIIAPRYPLHEPPVCRERRRRARCDQGAPQISSENPLHEPARVAPSHCN